MGSYQENVHNQARRAPVFKNITYLPTYQQVPIEESKGEELSWWQRRALDLRITTMAPPTKPYWNTTMVTAWVAVIVGLVTTLSAVCALWYFTDQSAEKRGYERGLQQAEQQQILERLQKTEEELRRTKELKLVQAGQQAGHPTPEEQK